MRWLIAVVALGAACGAHSANPDGPVLDARWMRAVKTPIVRPSRDADCGLAALAMLAGAWGRTWTVDELSRDLPPARSARLGTLRDLARARGLDAYVLSASERDLAHELGVGHPVMLGLALPFDGRRRLAHFEVVVAMNRVTGTVLTIDPETGTWKGRTREVLEVEWEAAHNAALLVTGTIEAAPIARGPR